MHRGADVSGARVLECAEGISEMRRRTVEATLLFDAALAPVSPVAAFPAEWPMPWGFEDEGMAHIAFTHSARPASAVPAFPNAG